MIKQRQRVTANTGTVTTTSGGTEGDEGVGLKYNFTIVGSVGGLVGVVT